LELNEAIEIYFLEITRVLLPESKTKKRLTGSSVRQFNSKARKKLSELKFVVSEKEPKIRLKVTRGNLRAQSKIMKK
jgi:hypothetical protein